MLSNVTHAGTLALENATRANIRFEHGAGQLTVRTGTDPSLLLAGNLGEHAEMDVRREGENVDVVVRAIDHGWRAWIDPTNWRELRQRFDWDVQINPTVPVTLEFATGASRSILDLSGLRATEVILKTGMSSIDLTLPSAAEFTKVEVHSGLADVTIRVPSGVAATIHGEMGLASLIVDQTRFRPIPGGFESLDYAGAVNRVQIRIEGGLETVRVL